MRSATPISRAGGFVSVILLQWFSGPRVLISAASESKLGPPARYSEIYILYTVMQ
jgi:hypothetical protein